MVSTRGITCSSRTIGQHQCGGNSNAHLVPLSLVISQGDWFSSKYPPHKFFSSFTDKDVLEYAKCTGACSVNMLIGLRCGSSYEDRIRHLKALNISETPIAVASRHLLGDFFFVGILEEYSDSVKVFANLTGTRIDDPDMSLALENFRPSSAHGSVSAETRKRVQTIYSKLTFEDDYLYRAALTRFRAVQLQIQEGRVAAWSRRPSACSLPGRSFPECLQHARTRGGSYSRALV